jgi:penicillin-binding protein 2
MERASSRLRVLAFLVVLMLAGLATRLWFLQVLATDRFTEAASENSIRFEYTDPVRGLIYDRNGDVLVDNQLSLEVRITKSELGGKAEAVVLRLAELLDIGASEISAALNSNRYYPFQAIPVAEFVDEEAAIYIREHPKRFPGVDVAQAAVRKYPHGKLGAHMVGNMGLITAELLEQVRAREYGPNDTVGIAGLERQYEKFLRGERGIQKYIVNADGETIRALDEIEPTAGDDLHLTIDAGWQAIAEEELAEGIVAARSDTDSSEVRNLKANAGAVVVLDAQTGAIRAMASYPTYDPRWYVRGLTPDQVRFLTKDPGSPALNHATFPYTPGSTFKAITSLIVMHHGKATKNGYYDCPATYIHGEDEANPFDNWEPVDRGVISFREALIRSCDTFFYRFGSEYFYDYLNRQIAENPQPLQRAIRKDWGFGEFTGLDLPVENAGLVPDAAFAAESPNLFFKGQWQPFGDILTMTGAGNLAATPLQVAQAYMAIANGGHRCRPHLVEQITDADGRLVKQPGAGCDRMLGYDPADLAYVRDALADVVDLGTASCAFSGFPLSQVPVGGKTGTAERSDVGKQDTSWFAAIVGPTDDPEYVVVTMVEQGGFGAQTAAPITRRVIEGIEGLGYTGACGGAISEDQ